MDLSVVNGDIGTTEASVVSLASNLGSSVRSSEIINSLEDDNRRLRQLVQRYEEATGISHSKLQKQPSMASSDYCIDCPDQTLDYMTSIVNLRYSRRGPCSIYRSLAKALFSVANDHCRIPEQKLMRTALQAQCRRLFRETITAEKVVRHIDCDGGGFLVSYKAVDSLRKLDCVKQKKQTRGFLPSKSALVRAAKKINDDAADIIPFDNIEDTEGTIATDSTPLY